MEQKIKNKIEKYLIENEGGVSFSWGKDSVTSFDTNGNPIEDYMIDIEDNGDIFYTSVSTPSVTLKIINNERY